MPKDRHTGFHKPKTKQEPEKQQEKAEPSSKFLFPTVLNLKDAKLFQTLHKETFWEKLSHWSTNNAVWGLLV